MSGSREYRHLSYASRHVTLQEVASGVNERVVEAALAAALHGPDDEWVETLAVALTLVSDSGVQRAGILALGHLARRFGHVDLNSVIEISSRLAKNESCVGALSDLADDIEVFVRK